MRIGIDGNEANIEQKVGVHQYAYEILWSLFKLNQSSNNKHSFKIYLKSGPSEDLPKENEWWKYKILGGKGMWILTRLTPNLFFSNENDVFFTPSHYLPPTPRVPKVFTVHDLGYLEFKDQFNKKDYYQLKYWTAVSINFAEKIIAVSESTKKDILRHYNIDPERIGVVHHGYDEDRFNNKDRTVDNKKLEKYKITKDYLLFLGTLKPSKNVRGLIIAYSNLDQDLRNKHDLVIAGMKGWLYDEIFQLVKKLDLQENIIFTGYIDEEDKMDLYKRAKVLVQPSFWEGFGMQVLDSLAVGTPVIISKVASLPEVGGDAALYVDPKDTGSITSAIDKVLGLSEVQYNRLVQKGLDQVKKFSWEKAGKQTLEVIEEAYENRK